MVVIRKMFSNLNARNLAAFIALFAPFMFSSQAHAVTWTWTSSGLSIEYIQPHNSGLIFFLSGPDETPNSSCDNSFIIKNADTNFELKVSALMSAYLAGHVLRVNFDNDDTGCRVAVDRFNVSPN